ncbi:type II toxin-antitoxin system toxin DNA ADP-ribosyl transferase DarT [Thermus scotoductus]|uniref:type II toxin-antitoxin system toxin DNA ADP-ribosyl transferase DarT n=1 Tax=Thermus scotoductus TaxID=37636 RepID=UPI00059C0FED|nr:DUF4433 domain-containing protein [Thermus scotoductus]
MSIPPARPKIYHITHVENLRGIVSAGALFSDATIQKNKVLVKEVGMKKIKQRRLTLPVTCHEGTTVGEYVPFNFCPRSVMLYVIYSRANGDLDYLDGQDDIVHLEADLYDVVQWADQNRVPWALSLGNAGAYHTEFRCSLESLDELDWKAITAHDFRDPDVKERKQAEFLIKDAFPFALVERIGVRTRQTFNRVQSLLSNIKNAKCPKVSIQWDWYF